MPAFFESLGDHGFDIELIKNIRELHDHGLTTVQFEDVLVELQAVRRVEVQDLLTAYPGQIDLNYVRNELDSVMAEDDPRRLKFESWVCKSRGSES